MLIAGIDHFRQVGLSEVISWLVRCRHEQTCAVPLVQRQRRRSRGVLPECFPHTRRLDELRSKGVGPWPVGKIATITIELEGQEIVFLNGGPAHQLNPAFSFFVRCDSQEEIDSYWGKLIEGGKPMACGWLTDRFGLCWQIVPRNIGELINHPKAMKAIMGIIKMDCLRWKPPHERTESLLRLTANAAIQIPRCRQSEHYSTQERFPVLTSCGTLVASVVKGIDRRTKASRLGLFLAASFLWGPNLSAQQDMSPHKVQLVTVEEGVPA